MATRSPSVTSGPEATSSLQLRAYLWLLRLRPAQLADAVKRLLPLRRRYVRTANGQTFWVDPVSAFGYYLLTSGTYEPQLTALLQRLLRREDVILDVGANEGYFSVIAAGLAPQGRVHCIEPQSRVLPVLNENLRLNQAESAVVHPLALSNAEGDVQLFLQPSTNTGASSLFHYWSVGASTEQVRATTLDRFVEAHHLERVRLIKIDCEGAESLIVQGGQSALRRHVSDFLVVDYHPQISGVPRCIETHRAVAAAGYRLVYRSGAQFLYASPAAGFSETDLEGLPRDRSWDDDWSKLSDEGAKRTVRAPRVLYVQYTNPAGYPPLQHSARLLADSGWQVHFLGADIAGVEALSVAPHARITVERLGLAGPGWREKLRYARFVLRTVAWTVRHRPHWIYASDLWAAPPALLASLLTSVRVAYHEHDAHSAAQASGFTALCFAARRRLTLRAALRVAPNEQRAARLAAETGSGAVQQVWNCPSRAEVDPPRGPLGDGDVWLLYHGNLSPDLLPATIVDALAALPPRVKLRLVGYETAGNETYARTLRERAQALGVSDRLDVRPAVSRGELMRLCGQCDVGIALMPVNTSNFNLRHLVGASNKPFDYLACGLPVLVSDLPEWRAVYVEPGYGLACNPGDPQSIAGAVRWLLERPDRLRAMGEAGRQRILQEWNYEAQFAPVLAAMSQPKPAGGRPAR